MDAPLHSMRSLFAQLGLPADPGDISGFFERHAPLEDGVALWDAPFWTPAQAQFLREEMVEDADWAPVIDRLNAALHAGDPRRP